MEKNVKDLEKTLDLDSCEQVTFKLPQQIGEGRRLDRQTGQ